MNTLNICVFAKIGLLAICLIISGCNNGSASLPEPVQTSTNVAPLPPSLLTVSSSEMGAVDIKWNNSDPTATYEIHVGESSNFGITPSSKVSEVTGSDTASVRGLSPGKTYYFRILGYRGNSEKVLGEGVLGIKPTAASLVPRTDIAVIEDTSLGLTAISFRWPELVLAKSFNSILPRSGDYLYGKIGSTPSENYFARIKSASENASSVIVTLEAPSFRDVFVSGAASFSTRSPSILTTGNALDSKDRNLRKTILASTSESDALECSSEWPNTISLDRISTNQVSFTPVLNGSIGYDLVGSQYATFSLGAQVSATSTIDLRFETALAAECKKTLWRWQSFHANIPTSIPGLFLKLGAGPNLKGKISVQTSAPIDLRFSNSIDALLQLDVVSTESSPIQISTNSSYFNSTAKPTLGGADNIVKMETAVALNFGADLLAGIGIIFDELEFKFGELSLGGDLSAGIEIVQTKGFINKYQNVELKNAKASLQAKAGASVGFSGRTSDWLNLSGKIEVSRPILNPIELFKAPNVELVHSITDYNLAQTQARGQLAVYSAESFQLLSQTSAKWYFDAELGGNTNGFADSFNYSYVVNESHCASVSVVDNIFGEVGRRFAPIVPIGSLLGEIIGFDNQFDALFNAHVFAETAIGPPGLGAPGMGITEYLQFNWIGDDHPSHTQCNDSAAGDVFGANTSLITGSHWF